MAVEEGARGGAVAGETGSHRPTGRRGGVHRTAATPLPRLVLFGEEEDAHLPELTYVGESIMREKYDSIDLTMCTILLFIFTFNKDLEKTIH